ncbi:MAG: hypothetical protein Q8Q14_02605, partial [Gemmatimonadales bacterium]|nr:hypothetical protein [Gemmatimonadales bacterium]
TPAERAAIPPTALALGIALGVSAVLVWAARRPILLATGYALVVMVIPIVSRDLLAAVGDDRSASALARVIQNTEPAPESARVLGISAYPPSLPFYLRRTIAVASPTGRELTSNFIADQHAQFRAHPNTPLLPADAWLERLAHCRERTVFITRTGDARSRAVLDTALPLLAVEGRYAAYGPCVESSGR